MTGTAPEDTVREFCAQQATLDDETARSRYGQRLTAPFDRWVHEPLPFPLEDKSRRGPGPEGDTTAWIDPRDVVVRATFHPYHHTPAEILTYTVENRGDPELHLRSMGDLWVETYPTPGTRAPLLMVTTNGNHRRLVYAAMGIPAVRAHLSHNATDRWCVLQSAWGDGPNMRMLEVFTRLGLVRDVVEECDEVGDRIEFTDPTRCVGWAWPASQGTPYMVATEVTNRMRALESIVGPVADPRAAVLRDHRGLTEVIAHEWGMPAHDENQYRPALELPSMRDLDGTLLPPYPRGWEQPST